MVLRRGELSGPYGFGIVVVTIRQHWRWIEGKAEHDGTGPAGKGTGAGTCRVRRNAMATFERPKSTEKLPADLLPVLRSSGILGDRQLAEIKTKVLHGEYPLDPIELAERLVEDEVLTTYQARRFL